jgi:hypothetical protein
MAKYNLNCEVTIYPTEIGWKKIEAIYLKEYGNNYERMLLNNKSKDGGYQNTLWEMSSLLHKMFFHGTQYFKNMTIKIKKLG